MSWLYTIFVAGFLYANGADQLAPTAGSNPPEIRVQERKDELIEKIERTFPLNSDGRVSLSNVNGSIVIEAWDRNEVHLEAVKRADSKESLDMIEININSRAERLTIDVDMNSRNQPDLNDKYRNRKMEVQFTLQVPRTAVLNEIEAVNGSVTISNFTNVTQISAVNGNVIASNLRGSVTLSTVNGEVRANFDRLDRGTSINLETVNGRVNAEVPSDINATIKAESLNGSIGNDFGLPVWKGKHVGRNLYGRIGSGEVRLQLESVNGPLSVTRRKDGKTPGSVTNLLNMTKGDDEDEDDGNDEVSAIVESAGVEAAHAAATSSAKATQKALKETHKELKETQKSVERIHPAIEKMKMPEIGGVKVNLNENEFKAVIAEGIKQMGRFPEMANAVWNAQPTSVDQRSRSFDVKGTPKVKVDAAMCAVRVRGWDKQTVKYVLTEERFSREGALSITENANENTLVLKISNGSKVRRPEESWGAENRFRLEVYVPRKTDLTVATNEEIRVEGISGRIDLSAESNPVAVRDSDGTLKLNSSDALIRVVGFRGDLDLTTTGSEVYLEGEFANIDACAGDASITLTLPSTRNASISTNTAIQSDGLNITREGDRTWRLGSGGPKYDFEFSDGHLLVRNQASVETN